MAPPIITIKPTLTPTAIPTTDEDDEDISGLIPLLLFVVLTDFVVLLMAVGSLKVKGSVQTW